MSPVAVKSQRIRLLKWIMCVFTLHELIQILHISSAQQQSIWHPPAEAGTSPAGPLHLCFRVHPHAGSCRASVLQTLRQVIKKQLFIREIFKCLTLLLALLFSSVFFSSVLLLFPLKFDGVTYKLLGDVFTRCLLCWRTKFSTVSCCQGRGDWAPTSRHFISSPLLSHLGCLLAFYCALQIHLKVPLHSFLDLFFQAFPVVF